MAITTIEIEKFLVFKDKFAADFCNGVNVFIGSNGSGKTTLMKVMYAASKHLFMGVDEYSNQIGTLNYYFDAKENIVSD